MNQLAESKHTPAPIEVYAETLRDLEMELDEAINSGHKHIIVVTYPETGIHEWL